MKILNIWNLGIFITTCLWNIHTYNHCKIYYLLWIINKKAWESKRSVGQGKIFSHWPYIYNLLEIEEWLDSLTVTAFSWLTLHSSSPLTTLLLLLFFSCTCMCVCVYITVHMWNWEDNFQEIVCAWQQALFPTVSSYRPVSSSLQCLKYYMLYQLWPSL